MTVAEIVALFKPDTPWGVVADMLREHGHDEAADLMAKCGCWLEELPLLQIGTITFQDYNAVRMNGDYVRIYQSHSVQSYPTPRWRTEASPTSPSPHAAAMRWAEAQSSPP